MSGYLSNLALRTIEQPPSIRPRLASLFEPATGPRIRVAEPPAAKRNRPARSASRRDADRPPPNHRAEGDVKPSPINQPTQSPEAPQLSHQPGDHRPEVTPAAGFLAQGSTQAVTPHATVVRNNKPRLEIRAPTIESTPSDIGHQPVHAASPEHVHRVELEAVHSPEAASIERTVAIETAVAQTSGLTLGEVANAVQSETHQGPAVIVRPDVTASFESPAQYIEQSSLAREAPSAVRITIGRVDVRAIMPPARSAAPARETKRGTSLSLEDYLQKRNGA